jgi:hypothetical protein
MMAYEVLRLNELDAGGLSNKVDRAQQILSGGDWGSLNVKKLRDKNIYRAKLDDSSRLLFQIGEMNQRKYVLLLEIIKNHNYAKSRFLRGGSASDSDFVTPKLEEPTQKLVYVNANEKRFQLLDKIVSFDEAQSRIFSLPLPLIVVGSAGSGKTALMLEKMKTLSGLGLYVTHSKFLVENSRRVYFANHYENDAQEIDFLSFKEFLQSIEVPEGKEIHFPVFQGWWQRNRIGSPIKDAHKLFEEFRGVLTGSATDRAHLTREDYLGLGVRQSIFLEGEKGHVYDLFQKYLQFLKSEKYYDQNLLSFQYLQKSTPKYDFIVVDEVQDLTSIQIKLLLKHLKAIDNWFLCGDSNQIVHPNFFSWSRVKSMFYQDEAQSPREIVRVLNNNFRNSVAVTRLANSILILKNKRFGSIDKESNFLVTSMSNENGQVLRLQNTEAVLQDLNKKTSKSAKFAVIVPNDQIREKAKAHFKTPLVFTVHEAKGLEYKNIVIFDFVSTYRTEFNEICAGVESISASEELTFSRAKDKTEKSLEVYKFFINSLYVAATRAVQNLIIVESQDSHRAFELLEFPAVQTEFNWSIEESNLDEWRAEARRLESQGKAEQAQDIHKLILGDKKPVPWKVMDSDTFAQLEDFASKRQISKIEKQDRQWFYHFSLVGGITSLQETLEKYQGKVNRESELTTIKNKYHLDYLGKNFTNLQKKIETYGIDFQNPFGRTPLQTAAVLGIENLAQTLVDLGANVNQRDLWGRSALGLTTWSALTDDAFRTERFSGIYDVLSEHPYSFQSRQKLWRLTRRPFEYFLFHLMFAHYYAGSVGNKASGPSYYFFDSEKLCAMAAKFPESVIPEHRKKRGYMSSILSKNEVDKDDPYNRGLFLRKARGEYTLNPAISFEVAEDTWISIRDFLRVDRTSEEEIFGTKCLSLAWS